MSITANDFGFVRDLVRRQSAIVLASGKEYLVESRLLPLARQSGETSVGSLVARLRSGDARLADAVVDAMTTNETSFFRDVHPFDALSQTVLPELVAARATERRLALWSAGASSGQEPYSMAMLVQDALGDATGWRSLILASDISEEMLARCRKGSYTQLEVDRGLPADRQARHFDQVDGSWQIRSDLRAMVDVRRMNLDLPFPVLPAFDVIFLRNVLIYFDPETKRQVLGRIRRVLRPDGYLFLGAAETTLNLDDAFERVPVGRAVAWRLRTERRQP